MERIRNVQNLFGILIFYAIGSISNHRGTFFVNFWINEDYNGCFFFLLQSKNSFFGGCYAKINAEW